ncbi:MAG: hypothetical protein GX803_06255 [Lentisphaerae bacterium]|jgi:endonuclease/exonuclease/phosphatase family metal-dependent hydrolase|nr:hypothetical protein [Lentisphaerota bacterium]
MKKTKSNRPAAPSRRFTAPTPNQIRYALLLLSVAILLVLLALPRPGLRARRLKPVLAPETPPPAASLERIRVATYNIENFTDARNDGPERTPERYVAQARGAADIIAEVNPDILLLQEIENARVLIYLNSLFQQPYDYIYVTRLRRPNGTRDRLNLGLLSRLPPRRVRQLDFHALGGPVRPARGTIAATFHLPGDFALMTYGIHLKSNFGDDARNRAHRGLALHVIGGDAVAQTYRNLPRETAAMILGDTNVDPDTPQFADDPSLEPLAGAFADLWLGRPIDERTTIPTRHPGETGDPDFVFPPSAFDRVFATRNLTADGPWLVGPPVSVQRGVATGCNITPPGVNGHISDHYLVYVDLTPNPDYTPPAEE